MRETNFKFPDTYDVKTYFEAKICMDSNNILRTFVERMWDLEKPGQRLHSKIGLAIWHILWIMEYPDMDTISPRGYPT